MTPNPQQIAVIEHVDGPCMVLAVPGSGKTASVTERIKRLVTIGVDPRSILAITFTNKAADEMRKRVALAVGLGKASLMTLCTFHSLCARIIRANAPLVGLTPSYSIYDEDDSERALKTAIRKFEKFGAEGEQAIPRDYLYSLKDYLEGFRNDCLAEGEALEKHRLVGKQKQVADEYLAQLRRSNAIDFTGLLSEALRLFNEHPDVRDKYATRFRYLSVDEVQDTNVAQYELVKHLASAHRNVVVVGDLDQAIYKFRGACPENVFKFEKDFQSLDGTPCKVLRVETNYRSTPSILKDSQRLVEHNTIRKPTVLRTDNADGERPKLIRGYTDYDMARLIASDASKAIREGFSPEEIAVLYRTNYSSRILEQAFLEAGIKYKVVNGTSFWDRKEVKFGLSLLKLMCNRNDRMAFEKSVEACCRGVGDKAIGAVSEISQTRGIPIFAAAEEFSKSELAAARALKPFVDVFNGQGGILPGDSVLKIAEKTALWERLERSSSLSNDRCANLTELGLAVDEYCSKEGNTLAGYLQSVSLLTDADQKSVKGAVKLMTMHASKGLEFDCVYVSHCTDDVLPHPRAVMQDVGKKTRSATEEERRLLYVSMTRARKRLSLCAFSMKGREKKRVRVGFSPFLFEIGLCSEKDLRNGEYFDD